MLKQRPLLLGVAAALIAGAGVVHGFWTNRWNTSKALADLAARMAVLPERHGDWVSVPIEMNQRELEGAGATSSVVRRYENETTGESVSFFLIAGLPSKISSHTPDVCYPGAGYTLGETRLVEIGIADQQASLRTALATNTDVRGSSRLRLYWGWDDGRGWRAPGDARGQYVSAPALCKLYVVRGGVSASDDPGTDPTLVLLRTLLPELHASLFSNRVPESGIRTN